MLVLGILTNLNVTLQLDNEVCKRSKQCFVVCLQMTYINNTSLEDTNLSLKELLTFFPDLLIS